MSADLGFERLTAIDPIDAADHCTACDRTRPAGEVPRWHTWVMSADTPTMDCQPCGGSHDEPRWHGFTVLNAARDLLVAGLVCPVCAVRPGFDAAVRAALVRWAAAAWNAN